MPADSLSILGCVANYKKMEFCMCFKAPFINGNFLKVRNSIMCLGVQIQQFSLWSSGLCRSNHCQIDLVWCFTNRVNTKADAVELRLR